MCFKKHRRPIEPQKLQELLSARSFAQTLCLKPPAPFECIRIRTPGTDRYRHLL